MSNPREYCEVLMALSQHYPDWRLGQLVANVADWADENVWDVEDERWIEAARLHLQQLAEREQGVRS